MGIYDHSKIKILSRQFMENLDHPLAYINLDILSHIVISITDNDLPDCNIPDRIDCQGILRLKSSDWNRNDVEIDKEYQFFTKTMATAVLEFINTHIDNIKSIIVHCEAGVSRSAGLAAALSKLLNNDDRFFFEYFSPNILVYNALIYIYFGNRDFYFNIRKFEYGRKQKS